MLPVTTSKTELEAESVSWAEKARDLRILDDASCVNASYLLRSIKSLRTEIANWFAPHLDAAMETKRKAEAARKGLADERDRMESPLAQAEGQIKKVLLAWEAQQEQRRLDEQKRLQEESNRRAEALAIEAAAALELEANTTGNVDMLQEANDLLAQPTEAPLVSVAKFTPKVQGVVYRDNWKAHETIDIKALAVAVANGTVSLTFLTPNVTALNNFARATKGTVEVPGVRFINDRQIAARA